MVKLKYIDKSAVVYGKVKLEKNSSIWPNAVLRADVNSITIGKNSNIQDNVVIHVNEKNSVEIGENVSIGHNAVIHGCKIKDNCLIGMGAIILNGAVIEKNCIIAAGTVVTERKKIPPCSLVMGIPGKVVRKITEEEKREITQNAQEYVKLAQKYQKEQKENTKEGLFC